VAGNEAPEQEGGPLPTSPELVLTPRLLVPQGPDADTRTASHGGGETLPLLRDRQIDLVSGPSDRPGRPGPPWAAPDRLEERSPADQFSSKIRTRGLGRRRNMPSWTEVTRTSPLSKKGYVLQAPLNPGPER
jgi:hypothetical protein